MRVCTHTTSVEGTGSRIGVVLFLQEVAQVGAVA